MQSDDELKHFEAHGAAPLPEAQEEGFVDNAGACIAWSTYGAGHPVVLLHGGLGHRGNWGCPRWLRLATV
ncbi:hypothetical protein PTKU64_58960 [Paraburkholderia terrae]|uniref:Alpha/beta hydrolase n=1 Tax=Paraburkholderia terrae TaxID=311230 RepID=A0ABN6JQF2_9BURK|nr:hypothetical protein PTKU64_58960 [Paraburkholderia terrae]